MYHQWKAVTSKDVYLCATIFENLLIMKKKLLIVALALLSFAGEVFAQTKSASLVLSAGTKYQYIDGFGGTGMNGQWGDVYTQEKAKKLWGRGEGQVGLNIMRLRINPNEGNWGEYGNAVKWARAVQPNLQVFATPWTPPKKYKTSKETKYQNEFGTWVWPLVEHSWGGEGSNGGTFNSDCYEEFADFLERYRQTMERKGCPIDMISIQNESDYTPTATDNGVEHASYESCIYSPKQMAAMVKAARAAVDPKCKIMGPECFGWGEHTYNNTLVGLKDAVDNIDVWGNHLYGTNDWSFVQSVTKKTGKHMWMTEFLIDYSNGYSGAFSAEYDMIRSIEQAMASGYSAYVYYNMLNDFFACNHGGSDTELWKRAYVFSHYAKYATGKTRIKSALTDSNNKLVGGSAYISQSGDTVTLFVLNTSATDTYRLVTGLPFVPEKITQIATSESVNWLVSDVTEKFSKGTQRPVLDLLPGVFYTFEFVKHVDEAEEAEQATSYKQPNYGNPLLAHQYLADPTSVVHDGRLYVYATNDQQEFELSGGLAANTYGKITQLACISTADMVNWTNHGVIDVKAIAPWVSAAWAPSIVSREESDGQTHFYLYFTNSGSGIGVLTSTSPTGPWTDPLGKALVDSKTAGLGTISSIIDPGVAIKPDGTEAYLTFGGGDVKGTDLQPGNARIVKLGDDMLSLASDIKSISAPCHFEANELNYIGNKWVFSYCTRWNIASNWKSYSSKAAPTPCAMVYMTATDPLADKWAYQGEILPNPGRIGYPSGNNHSRLQKFGNSNVLLYHTQWLEHQNGLSAGYRNLQMNRVVVVEGSAKISALTSTTASLSGFSQLTSAYVDPYTEQSGRMSAITTKDWWLVRGVNFAGEAGPARSLSLKVKGAGTVEVRFSAVDAEPVAKIEFDTEEEKTVTADLDNEVSAFQPYLYFVFTSNAGAEVLSWQFHNLSAEEAVGIDELSAPSATSIDAGTDVEYYSTSGVRLAAPQKGVTIVRQGGKTVKQVRLK